jgi:hypothetical protein
MEDLLGRDLVLPFAARNALVTATATLTNGTNTLLITGDADYPLDLVHVTFANQSTAAAQVTLKDDGTSVRTLNVPLSDTLELKPNVPIIQSAKGGNWTVDMGDTTGTTLVVDAIFIKNR